MGNSTQLAKLVVATTGKLINVCCKVKFLVKDDPKVKDSVTEDKMRKGFSDQASVNILQSSTTTQPALWFRRSRLEARQPDRESIARHNWRTIVTAQSGLAWTSSAYS